MRRTKQDVDRRLELPPCDFQNVELELFPEERAFYKEVYTSAQKRFKEILSHENSGMEFLNMLECFLRARQALIHPQLFLQVST
jgi:hypothetical protein